MVGTLLTTKITIAAYRMAKHLSENDRENLAEAEVQLRAQYYDPRNDVAMLRNCRAVVREAKRTRLIELAKNARFNSTED